MLEVNICVRILKFIVVVYFILFENNYFIFEQSVYITFMIRYLRYLHVVVSLLKGQSEYTEDWWELVLRYKHKAKEVMFHFSICKSRYLQLLASLTSQYFSKHE